MHTSKHGIRAPFLGRQHNPAGKIPGGLPEQAVALKHFNSHELFGAQNEVTILHRGERYSLRITGLGKLILTK